MKEAVAWIWARHPYVRSAHSESTSSAGTSVTFDCSSTRLRARGVPLFNSDSDLLLIPPRAAVVAATSNDQIDPNVDPTRASGPRRYRLTPRNDWWAVRVNRPGFSGDSIS